MDPLTRLLRDLVQIPSVNPMGRPLAGPGILETDLSLFLEGFFQALGVPVERQRVAEGRENLIVRYKAPKPGPTVLFDVHQDTIPTDGMSIDPFLAQVEGGRLYGRGACDVKGSMAAMLSAFARLVRERPEESASVVLACTVDEEYTHMGSSKLAAEPVGADVAIVAEPTRLDVVNTHKGAVRWKVRALGRACHSSTPQLGVNAIYRMAKVVEALAEYACQVAGSEPDPVLGAPSLSVGRIVGGTSANVVPDVCTIEIDRRVIPGEDPGEVPRAVKAFLERKLGSLEGLEFLPPWVNMPALRAQPTESDRWLPGIKEAIRKVRGTEPGVGGVPFGTDAGPLGASGLASYVFGPGDIAQAHTEDEWIELDQVRLASEIYYEFALTLR